ncbi:MAG: 3-phosphoserine/phosphohydroxythreonine transaminase [Pseudomonadales bacterium]|nr:3-phosphoserine/phosphohydroxythreonine transaminase [Pseudomonadales bacterium]NIX06559.1 3-phosphoserine/phosphohydroxythreonine transaminase [Pseudomonadales bacterium]
MNRAINFSAGPAALPTEVLEQAQAEMLDYAGTGMSVMEMSHRSAEFIDIAERAERDLRELLQIPDDYHVLFLQGGATLQFAMVPLNLLGDRGTADYVNTGSWSTKAIKEAARFCSVNVAASAEEHGFDRIPDPETWACSPDAAYLHICSNETIGGVQFHSFPDREAGRDVGPPLVADMSSDILSRPIDVSRFGLIYAGAQKNVGPAGLTIVIVRKDLVGAARPGTPSMLDYAVHAEAGSMSNTPPTYAWYLAGLVFAWVRSLGGVAAVEERNRRKAAKLYEAIDGSNLFRSPVVEEARSTMNVPFTLPAGELDAAFLAGATERGLLNLKGHRSVGGMRASLYNAVPESAVDALIAYMREFETDHLR